jgi:CBS domain containing-hemolysin-like protein
VEGDATLADFLAMYSHSPHSRFPVYEDTIDQVNGLISIKDVLMAEADGALQPEGLIGELVRPTYFVPETKRIGKLFTEMQSLGYQMAVVVDEFGGTAGMVTLEQLVEEIVGEVRDELVKETKEYEVIGEHTFQVDGSMRLDEVNDELGLSLPKGDYDTIAGFVLSILGHIPEKGEQVRYADLRLVVEEMKGMRIEKILIEKIAMTGEEHAASEGQVFSG